MPPCKLRGWGGVTPSSRELPGPHVGRLEHAAYTLDCSSTLGSPLLSPQKFFLEFKAAEVYLVWFRSQRGPRRAPERRRPGNCRESGGTVYCLAPVSPPWWAVAGEVAPEGHAGGPLLFPPLTAKAGR